MTNPNNPRRALGLLMVFASALALMALWNLSETER
jgi:hypothetical protein